MRTVRMPAATALKNAGLAPLVLAAKEGLALINGTQVSTALALHGLFMAERLLEAGTVTGALNFFRALMASFTVAAFTAILLMALGADHAGKAGLGARMGAVGACISLGVATGAPLGGFIGGIDPLWVPLGGGVLSLALAVAGFVGLADSTSARPRMAAAEIVVTLR